MHPVLLRPPTTYLAFCNDFDTHHRYNDNFFAVMIRRKRKFILAKEKFGVSGTLR